MSASSFTAQHFHYWNASNSGPYNYFRSGTRGPTGGTVVLSDFHAYRGLAWFDAAAIATALSGKRVTAVALTFESEDWDYESIANTGIRLYITDLGYDAGNAGYNSADDARWTLGMTAANPYNAHMTEYGTTPSVVKGGTLTAGVFATGEKAQRFATALMAGYAIGTFELKPGTSMTQSELYKVRSTSVAPIIVITYEDELTDCTPPTSAGLLASYGKTTVPLAYAGATGGGVGHTIAGINYKYAESDDGTTWGAYSAATTIAATTGDGTINVPVGAIGKYRKYQVAAKSADGTVTAYIDAEGMAYHPSVPAAPDVTASVSGRIVTYTVTCAADAYGLWTTLKRALDGGTAEIIQAVPPSGGVFTITETLETGAHSAVFRCWDLFGGYSASTTKSFTCTVASTGRKDWLKWNGVNSKDYSIIVLEQPEPDRPEERITYEKVLGREGYVHVSEADDVYDTIEKTATVYLQDGNFDEARGWLKGFGTVEFGNEPGYLYQAYISSVVKFETIVKGRLQKRAMVTFTCQPFKYLAEEDAQIHTISGGYLTNLGNVQAKPIITVYGEGDLTLTIGETTMTMAGVVESVTLDCQEMIAMDENGEDYTALTGDFFRVPVGTSQITWTGEITSISILLRRRYA
jgi:phage-related protein